MSRLEVGQIAPDFTRETAYDGELSLKKALTAKHTVLYFSRYYGCSLCQLDLQDMAENHGLLTSKGAAVLVVLQSEPETLRSQNAENPFPYPVICDPTCALYQEWGITPASSKAELVSPRALAKIAKAKAAGFSHGKYEGEELQLPALFILAPDGKVEYAKYAKNLGDLPDAEDIAKLIAGLDA